MQNGERRQDAGPKFRNPHISGNHPSCEDGATKPNIFDSITEVSAVKMDTTVKPESA